MSFIVIAIYDLGNSYSWFNISFMQHIMMIGRDKVLFYFQEEILMHYIRVGIAQVQQLMPMEISAHAK